MLMRTNRLLVRVLVMFYCPDCSSGESCAHVSLLESPIRQPHTCT